MKILNQVEVLKFLISCGVTEQCDTELADEHYVLPDLDWLHGSFSQAWTTLLDLGKLTYSTDAFDCDKYARLAAAYASVLNAKTLGHPNAGIAIGEIWYESVNGGHAINFAVTEFDGALALRFFEPQIVGGHGFKEVQITRSELATAWYVRI